MPFCYAAILLSYLLKQMLFEIAASRLFFLVPAGDQKPGDTRQRVFDCDWRMDSAVLHVLQAPCEGSHRLVPHSGGPNQMPPRHRQRQNYRPIRYHRTAIAFSLEEDETSHTGSWAIALHTLLMKPDKLGGTWRFAVNRALCYSTETPMYKFCCDKFSHLPPCSCHGNHFQSTSAHWSGSRYLHRCNHTLYQLALSNKPSRRHVTTRCTSMVCAV